VDQTWHQHLDPPKAATTRLNEYCTLAGSSGDERKTMSGSLKETVQDCDRQQKVRGPVVRLARGREWTRNGSSPTSTDHLHPNTRSSYYGFPSVAARRSYVGRSREIDNTWWYGGRIEALVNNNNGAAGEWTRRRFVLAPAAHVHPNTRNSHNGFHVLRSVVCVQVEAGNYTIRYGRAGGVSRC
jgi:hypothetical protein